jgi:hypothetical protein
MHGMQQFCLASPCQPLDDLSISTLISVDLCMLPQVSRTEFAAQRPSDLEGLFSGVLLRVGPRAVQDVLDSLFVGVIPMCFVPGLDNLVGYVALVDLKQKRGRPLPAPQSSSIDIDLSFDDIIEDSPSFVFSGDSDDSDP